MLRTNKPAILLFACFCVLALFPLSSVQAETAGRVLISSPDTSRFPEITFFASIIDDQGQHIPNLSDANVQVLEDSEIISQTDLTEEIGGTRQVFAINSVRGLRGRDAEGLTRFDYVRLGLMEWWSRADAADAGADDLVLLTADSPLTTHASMAAELAAALDQYEPTYTEEPVGADLLMQALDHASDPVPHPGMTRHVIFITPILRGAEELPLSNAIAKAKSTGTAIHPVLVGPAEIMDLPEVANLQLLADETGGTFTYFNEQGLSGLADRILSQRSVYRVTYASRANRSGLHVIQLQHEQGVRSSERRFSIQVAPPEVAFIQPPDQITRQSEDPAMELKDLPPTSFTMRALITFPDGKPRQIKRTQWLIDDHIVLVQRDPPFDVFEWDLSQYLSTGTHSLQIVVEDVLGLQTESPILTVRVIVDLPPSGFNAIQPFLGTLGVILGILIGSILLGVVLVGRVRARHASSEADAAPSRHARRRRAGLQSTAKGNTVEAFLEPLDSEHDRINLIGTDLTLGRDPALTPAPFLDASVSGLHARVVRLANGAYQIKDQGSIAGTWVNYLPVPEDGKILQHGDLIHLGYIGLRFLRAVPPEPPAIHIRRLAESPETNERTEEGSDNS